MKNSVPKRVSAQRRGEGVALALAFALWLAPGIPGSADTLEGGRFSLSGTVTSGGGVAAGARFTLDGAIGQPDTETSRGGPFQLTGGLRGPVVIPGDAELQVELLAEGKALLTWPSEAAGFLLESATQLGQASDWSPVQPAPTNNTLVVPADGPLRFYRLRRP